MGRLARFAFNKVENYVDARFYKCGLVHTQKEFGIYNTEFWDSGFNKAPLILIHGFGAEAKYQWMDQISFLSQHYRLVIPNLLHFGRTDSSEERYSVQDQVEFLHCFLYELGIDCCTILGASYGGLVGIELARQFPDRVSRLVIQGAPVKFIYDSDQYRIAERFKLNRIHDLFVPESHKKLNVLISASNGRKSFIPHYFLKPFHDKFYGTTANQKIQLMEKMISIRDVYASHNYELEIPVHLIWGSNDPIVPVDRAMKLKEHIGVNATLDVIRNGGHMANMVKPTEFNSILNRLLIL